MAKLNIDLDAIKVRELLNHRKREEALAFIKQKMKDGTAGPSLQKIALELLDAPKGRPKTGLYKWIEIGEANYWMEAEGVRPKQRMLNLMKIFNQGQKHIEACITVYNKTLNDEDKL